MHLVQCTHRLKSTQSHASVSCCGLLARIDIYTFRSLFFSTVCFDEIKRHFFLLHHLDSLSICLFGTHCTKYTRQYLLSALTTYTLHALILEGDTEQNSRKKQQPQVHTQFLSRSMRIVTVIWHCGYYDNFICFFSFCWRSFPQL